MELLFHYCHMDLLSHFCHDHGFLSYYCSLKMAAKYIILSTLGSFVIAYACDQLVSDKKIFGGKLLLYFLKLLLLAIAEV